MSRSRKTQRLVFDPSSTELNDPPEWRTEAVPREELPDEARKQYLLNGLLDQFKIIISKDIRDRYNANGNLDDLKIELKGKSRLPRYTVTNAEQRINAVGEISRFLANTNRTITSMQRWNNYIDDNWETLCNNARRDRKGKGRATEGETSTTFAPKTPTTETADSIDEEASNIRTVTCGFNSILRADLPLDIKTAFTERISQAIVDASDYISSYSVQVYKLALLLQSSTFNIQEDGVVTLQPTTDQLTRDILPQGFPLEERFTHMPPPVHSALFLNAKFTDEFDKLFDTQHLQDIHTVYFGEVGEEKSKEADRPIHAAMVNALPPSGESNINADPFIMKMALSKYMTNFKNMYSSVDRFYSLLSHVILVLLRIHLAPERERKKRERINNRTTSAIAPAQEIVPHSIPVEAISLIDKSYNSRKRLFKQERRRQEKYFMKTLDEDNGNSDKWIDKFERCQDRLNTYEEVLITERRDRMNVTTEPAQQDQIDDLDFVADYNPPASQELLQLEDSIVTPTATADSTSRRINTLKAVSRRVILANYGHSVDESIIEAALPGIKQEELRVCHLIINGLIPYVPPKNKLFVVARQLPLSIMCNQLFHVTGYSKWKVRLTPITKPTSLLALKLDAPSIYTLVCGSKYARKMNLFDFDRYLISSRDKATSSKDGVFSSFFDIRSLYRICEDHGLTFAQNMYVLPGLKTLRVNGSLIQSPQQTKAASGKASTSKHPQTPAKTKPSTSTSTSSSTEQDEKVARAAEIERLENQKRAISQERTTFYLNNSIGQLKKGWIKQANNDQDYQHNQQLHNEINRIKEIRNDINQRLIQISERLSFLRQSSYQTTLDDVSEKRTITNSDYKVIDDVANVKLHEELVNPASIRFTGTDNGLVTMTETVGFSFDQFMYHLELYMQKTTPVREGLASKDFTLDELSYHKIPKSFSVRGSDIDYGSGTRYLRRHIETSKKLKPRIHQIEAALTSIKNVHNIEELDVWMENNSGYARELRDFYHSPHMARKKRQHELRKRKFIDNLCSQERKCHGENEDPRRLVMFVGDRGTGVGSRIKGFQKYGGHWKPRKNSLYTPVCYTNEHNTSQNCIFCFGKLAHPIRIKQVDNDRKAEQVTGSFICLNENCITRMSGRNTHSRDKLSALAIGLAGCAKLLLGVTFPCFDHTRSINNAEKFQELAGRFLERKST